MDGTGKRRKKDRVNMKFSLRTKENNSLGVEDVDSSNSIVSCSSSDLKRVAGTRLVTIESVGTLWLETEVETDELGLATGASSRAESG